MSDLENIYLRKIKNDYDDLTNLNFMSGVNDKRNRYLIKDDIKKTFDEY